MGMAVILAMDSFSFPSLGKRWLASGILALVISEVVSMMERARHLDVLATGAFRGRAGEEVQIWLSLRNRGRRDALVSARLAHRRQPTRWGWVARRQETILSPIVASQRLGRGEHAFPEMVLRSHSLLRLCYVQRKIHADIKTSVVVWPARWDGARPAVLPQAEARTTQTHEAAGQALDNGASTADPHGMGGQGWLRNWRQGDRLAHIAHKASAHRGALLVQTATQDDQDIEQEVWLTWSWALGFTQGDPEAALRLLGSAVEWAHEAGQWVGLALPGQTFGLARGPEHVQRLLDALARWHVGAHKGARGRRALQRS